jgi:RimJ/RimL family protein N-acetyltransferase
LARISLFYNHFPHALAGSALPLEGPIAEGECISLGWPEPAEYDFITALRNRSAVRPCFLDSRPLDQAANRDWLARGMNRPREGLLSLRIGPQRSFCGTIGWSGYEANLRTFEIGRLAVDAAVVRPHRASFPPGYAGVGVDASVTLLRFAFERMGLEYVTSFFLSDRAPSRRVHLLAGGRHVGEAERERPDGTRVRVTLVRITRAEWLAMHDTSDAAVQATKAVRR